MNDEEQDRRTFFKRAIGMAGGAILLSGSGTFIAACNNAAGPTGPDMSTGVTINGKTVTLDTTKGNWTTLASAGGFADVDALGQQLVVFRLSGSVVSAMSRICPHAGCDVTQSNNGTLGGDRIVCNCHNSVFLTASGQVVSGPARTGLKTYPAAIAGSSIILTIG